MLANNQMQEASRFIIRTTQLYEEIGLLYTEIGRYIWDIAELTGRGQDGAETLCNL